MLTKKTNTYHASQLVSPGDASIIFMYKIAIGDEVSLYSTLKIFPYI